jgi:hypothetical protein
MVTRHFADVPAFGVADECVADECVGDARVADECVAARALHEHTAGRTLSPW